MVNLIMKDSVVILNARITTLFFIKSKIVRYVKNQYAFQKKVILNDKIK
jgi:hypothetical protein